MTIDRTRWACGVEYDGTAYHGWQMQEDLPTVQLKLQEAVAAVADHAIQITCAGRTDTGVHAWGQVIHYEAEVERSPGSWLRGVNSNLPEDIALLWVKEVNTDFHARFSAEFRRYVYIIYNTRVRSPLLRRFTVREYRPLDEQAMHEAAQYLLGENDFSTFRAADCQSITPRRRVRDISVRRQQDLVVLSITANAFLRHMVRNIAGSLIDVGVGVRETVWIKEILAARNRDVAGTTAKSEGLFLAEVGYPGNFEIPRSPGRLQTLFAF